MGLSLAYSVTLTGMFQYCVRVSAEVENLVNAAPVAMKYMYVYMYDHIYSWYQWRG